MLSLASAPISFSPMVGAAATRAVSIKMQVTAPEPEPVFNPVEFTKALPGVAGPLGFFDPLGFCSGEATEGRVRFIREVELKHARVAMLAALGFLVGENFHPLWGGVIDVPSYIAFQQTPLQVFWQWTLTVIGVLEIASISTFELPIRSGWKAGKEYYAFPVWSVKSKHTAGDFGFDPMGAPPPRTYHP